MFTKRLVLISAFLLVAGAASAAAPPMTASLMPWKPVDPAELASKTPKVEKDADAEALLWEERILDEVSGSRYPESLKYVYVRIKIYTQRGKELKSTIKISAENGETITDLAGRTIRPDGSIVELKNDSELDTSVVSANGRKESRKKFAMPGVEVGSIIEYRYRVTRTDDISHVWFYVQQDIPVQVARFHVLPFVRDRYVHGMRELYTPVMHMFPFNCENLPWKPEANDYSGVEYDNVPAYKKEPNMPPEKQVRGWMLIYYTETEQKTDKYWSWYANRVASRFNPLMKANGPIRDKAKELTAGASTPEEKLKRLYDYCRTSIKNIDRPGSGYTPEQRKDWKEDKSSDDTLRQGAGRRRDINLLFGALAIAAGFDAQMAEMPNRHQMFFRPEYVSGYFMREIDIAVRVDGKWRVFDPGGTYIPFGMLSWGEEDVPALIASGKAEFVNTPLTDAPKSAETRKGAFQLKEDGTLEGTVRSEWTGHPAEELREAIAGQTAAEREEKLKEQLKTRLNTTDFSELKIENADDPEKPLVYTYKLRVPRYATRTGKRLFVQPAFFEAGINAPFTVSERKFPVCFHYPWSESDTVSIALPEGFDFDNIDAPAPLAFGPAGKYEVKLALSQDKKTLVYSREFAFGYQGAIVYEAKYYNQIKQIFDTIHERDNHVVTLKQIQAEAK
ncbi:MAG: DUF3857 and transglutaminase domain-containing protein [Bryobacteraceae bacterium]